MSEEKRVELVETILQALADVLGAEKVSDAVREGKITWTWDPIEDDINNEDRRIQ